MPQESPYQLESLSYSAKLGLYLLVAAHDITTSNLPVAGTTTVTATGTNGLKLPTAGRPHSSYDNYIYTHLSPAATAGYFRLNFVDVFPTTPLVMEDIDPIWGKVRTHTYVALSGSAIPDIADEWIAGRYVLRVGEQHLSGDVCIVTVTTVPVLTVSHTDKPVDEETGALYTRTRTWTLATSAPSGAATDSSGQFTAVEQQSHRLWLSTVQPSSLIGIGYANARVYETQESLYWPAVMTNFQLTTILNQLTNPDSMYLKYIQSWRMRDAFSDPVKCVVSEWWQKTAPTWGSGDLSGVVGSATMQPAACHITGNLMSLSIPECLHGEVSYDEQDAVGTLTGSTPWVDIDIKMIDFTWAATNYTDWPATFTKVFSKPSNGGYLCRSEVYHRPTVSGGGLSVDTPTDVAPAT